jgi:hypothetical protein
LPQKGRKQYFFRTGPRNSTGPWCRRFSGSNSTPNLEGVLNLLNDSDNILENMNIDYVNQLIQALCTDFCGCSY